MIESITIAETGLRAFEQGLQTISNNTANLDTPGFKGSSTQFAELFNGGSGMASAAGAGFDASGSGVDTLGTRLDFSQGQLQTTGNPLDLAVDGQGYFTLKDTSGNIHYTRDGEFKFDSDGVLVSVTTGEQVMALDASGSLVPISLAALRTGPAKATGTVVFSGNLSSSATSDSVGGITVIDDAGGSHTLTLKLAPVNGAYGSWTATLMDGSTAVGTGTLSFAHGTPTPGSNQLAFTYAPGGGSAALSLDFDFSTNVTSFDSGTSSTLAVASQDGYGVGSLTRQSFDSTGTLVLSYSNGQTQKAGQLALAQFNSPDDVASAGNNAYVAKGGNGWLTGTAGTGQFGSVSSGSIETSNVDLSQEFSNLVIMQRGYQACSQVVSTASDMLTALFGMWSK